VSTRHREIWSPIEDLPSSWRTLGEPRIPALRSAWADRRAELEAKGLLGPFQQRLAREFAIETGLLERLYDLDRGTTVQLIEHGIRADLISHNASRLDPKRVAALIQDQLEAVDLLLDFIGRQRLLSVSFVKEVHALLTRHQEETEAIDTSGRMVRVPLLRGDWKHHPNNPRRPDGAMVLYAPPEHVAMEMERLVSLHLQHEREGVGPEVEACWLHHRFTQVHPFQDGNGRVARCLASLVLLRAGLFPFLVRNTERATYIEALERADGGALQPLLEIAVRTQEHSFLQALSVASSVVGAGRVEDVIRAARVDLESRAQSSSASWLRLEGRANQLLDVGTARLGALRQQLEVELQPWMGGEEWGLAVGGAEPGRPAPDTSPVAANADRLGYKADVGAFHRWTFLRIDTATGAFQIVLSAHGVGHRAPGVLALSIFATRSPRFGASELGPAAGLESLTDSPFLILEEEPEERVRQRFDAWFEHALARGLDAWRRSL
jgi:Fic family protein